MLVKKIYAASYNFQPITGQPGSYQANADPGSALETFFSNLLATFTIVGGITFLIYFVIGAFNYITAQGDREKVAKAQRYMSNGLIGLMIVILTWSLVGIVGSLFGIDILDLATLVGSLGGP